MKPAALEPSGAGNHREVQRGCTWRRGEQVNLGNYQGFYVNQAGSEQEILKKSSE